MVILRTPIRRESIVSKKILQNRIQTLLNGLQIQLRKNNFTDDIFIKLRVVLELSKENNFVNVKKLAEDLWNLSTEIREQFDTSKSLIQEIAQSESINEIEKSELITCLHYLNHDCLKDTLNATMRNDLQVIFENLDSLRRAAKKAGSNGISRKYWIVVEDDIQKMFQLVVDLSLTM